MCGYSAAASAVLSRDGKYYTAVNVLADPEIRQGIKVYGNWPTIPQLYVGGELMGGSDIMRQMHESGELLEVIERALAKVDSHPRYGRVRNRRLTEWQPVFNVRAL